MIDTASEKGEVTVCENLCPDTTGRRLVPVGVPATLSTGSWRPFHTYSDDDGNETFILVNNRRLKIVDETSETVIGPLDGVPLTAISASGSIIVMTTSETVRLIRDEDSDQWRHEKVSLPCSPLALVAADYRQQSVAVPATALTGAYSARSRQLDPTDSETLGNSLKEAYRSLAAEAAESGCRLQPCIGYYRLVDADGREIYRSCPVVLGPSAGLNCCQSITAPLGGSGSGYESLGEFQVEATTCRVGLRLCCDPEASGAMELIERASAVEIWLTPQLHPVDFARSVPTRIETSSSGAQLSFFMPGTSSAMTPTPGCQGTNAKRLLARLDEAADPVVSIPLAELDLSEAGATTWLDCGATTGVDDERTNVKKVAARRAETTVAGDGRKIMEQCMPPHSFRAAVSATSGSTVVWGDITPRLFSGYGPWEFGRDVSTGYSTMISTVETEDGDTSQRVVTSVAGRWAAPLTLSPLICYPLPGATCLAMTIEAPGAVVRRHTFNLESLPGCRYAFSLDPTLRPRPIATWDIAQTLAVPSEIRRERNYSNAVITADISSPLIPIGATVASGSKINAIEGAPRSASGWSISTQRFYMFTSGGAYSLPLDSGRRPGCPVLLKSGSFGRGVYFTVDDTLYAVDNNGSLVMFKGTRPLTLMRGVKTAGWCSSRREFWIVREDGVRVYDEGISRWHTRPGLRIKGLATTSDHLLAEAEGGVLLDLSSERGATETAVRWTWRRRMDRAVSRIKADILGEDLQGSITLSGDGGVMPGLPLVALSVEGTIDRPVTARVIAPRRQWASLEIAFKAGADFSLGDVELA